MLLIDYSTLHPPVSLLEAAGVTGVGRYIGWDCQPGFQCIGKNLTRAERDELVAAGIEIWLSFEYAANAALSGASQGTEDGHLASKQIADLDMEGIDVYYAVDFDLADFAPTLPNTPPNARAKLGPVANYFDAIHATKPNHVVSAYGGYWAIKRLLDAGLIKRGWQTLAWSAGQTDPRISLLQLIKQVLGAADVDNIPGANVPQHDNFGQWPLVPVPLPPPPAVITDGIMVSKTMHWTGHRMKSADHGENWSEVNE